MPRPLSIHVQERPLRCALCHGDAFGSLRRCRRCGTLIHQDCAEAHPGCPTLGCPDQSRGDPHPRGPARRDPGAPGGDPSGAPSRRTPLARLLREGLASSRLHLLATLGGGALLLCALLGRPLAQERALGQLERAARIYHQQEGRWPRDVGELWLVRHQAGGYPRRTSAGELYRFVTLDRHLLVVWQGEEGWRAHPVAQVDSGE